MVKIILKMNYRESNDNDWDLLYPFYKTAYRENHPLCNFEFWRWQYGDPQNGRSFICLNNDEKIVGHVGANFGGGLAWMMNLFIQPEYRGKGIVRKLYEQARAYYPLATTGANEIALEMYRGMRWHRYQNLVRMVKINPTILNPETDKICKNTHVEINQLIKKDSHYFKQPSIVGIEMTSKSRAVSQHNIGGLRITDINNIQEMEDEAWHLGYLWIDYVTSWNDLTLKNLTKNKWILDNQTAVPWLLNPLKKNSFCSVPYLSEEPVDKNLIVHRSYCDHGRIGSI